jgi:hypothetical protein
MAVCRKLRLARAHTSQKNSGAVLAIGTGVDQIQSRIWADDGGQTANVPSGLAVDPRVPKVAVGNPACTECGQRRLYHPNSIARGSCATCFAAMSSLPQDHPDVGSDHGLGDCDPVAVMAADGAAEAV